MVCECDDFICSMLLCYVLVRVTYYVATSMLLPIAMECLFLLGNISFVKLQYLIKHHVLLVYL